MTAGRAPEAGAMGTRADPEALREEIAQARVELSRTVSALADKMDVKTRTREAVRTAREDLAVRARNAADTGAYLATTLRRRLATMGPGGRVGIVLLASLLVLAGVAGRLRAGHRTPGPAGRRPSGSTA